MKAVTFDMWNTLIQEKHYGNLRVRCLASALTEVGVTKSYGKIREAYLSTYEYVETVWKEENYRFVSVDERLRHILERLNAELAEEQRLEVLRDFQEYALSDPPDLAEGARETLGHLSSRLRMGIICDSGYTPGRILRKALARHRVLGFFQVTTFSDENGFNKPHGTMFEKTLTSLCVEPSEAVHIGDSLLTDIAGAKAAGMKAVWLNPNGEPAIGSHKPDYQITALPEVIGILNEVS